MNRSRTIAKIRVEATRFKESGVTDLRRAQERLDQAARLEAEDAAQAELTERVRAVQARIDGYADVERRMYELVAKRSAYAARIDELDREATGLDIRLAEAIDGHASTAEMLDLQQVIDRSASLRTSLAAKVDTAEVELAVLQLQADATGSLRAELRSELEPLRLAVRDPATALAYLDAEKAAQLGRLGLGERLRQRWAS